MVGWLHDEPLRDRRDSTGGQHTEREMKPVALRPVHEPQSAQDEPERQYGEQLERQESHRRRRGDVLTAVEI